MRKQTIREKIKEKIASIAWKLFCGETIWRRRIIGNKFANKKNTM